MLTFRKNAIFPFAGKIAFSLVGASPQTPFRENPRGFSRARTANGGRECPLQNSRKYDTLFETAGLTVLWEVLLWGGSTE
jgi:hypothetical protein